MHEGETMTFNPKTYQTKVLDIVAEFFGAAHEKGAAAAYMDIAHRQDKNGKPLNPYAAPAYQTFAEGLEDRAHACVRVPTAGGKTYMAARSLEILHNYREEHWAKAGGTEMRAPLILWLVPTSVIRAQTAEVLSGARHPCAAEIRKIFGNIRILDINDFDIIMPQDLTENGALFISTVQMFRAKNTESRRIYAGKEDFDAHFSRFLPNPAPAGLEFNSEGNPKHSFINLLHLARPIVVCDEAQGFTTELSREVLQRINPACVLEWTATPRRGQTAGKDKRENIKHNVLWSIPAAELDKAEMIKMPVRVGEHENWEQAAQAAAAERARLEKTAAEHGEPVRPVALYKAESAAGDVTVQTLKTHLMSALQIAEEEIAVATGGEKELDGVNLLDAACKIRHIITVEALREGWDCSFAYVFCSAANVQSKTAAEQFLGRIMRMPFAQKRAHPDLNRAYAHMPADYATSAVEVLRENMALNLGYEEEEARWIIQPALADDEDLWGRGGGAAEMAVDNKPDFSELPEEDKESAKTHVEIKPAPDGGFHAVIRAPVSDAVQTAIANAAAPEKREETRRALQQENRRLQIARSPARRGVKFAPLPEFLFFSPETEEETKADNDSLYEAADWNDLGENFLLENFSHDEKGKIYEISLRGGKVPYQKIGNYQGEIFGGAPEHMRAHLAAWLEYKIRDPHGQYAPETLKKFIGANLDNLLSDPALPVEILTRAKHQLARALKAWLKEREEKIDRQTAGRFLFDNPELKCAHSFQYPEKYAPSENAGYSGAFYFTKHYYADVGAFDSDEEYQCAKALDMAPGVKHWVRNISRHPKSYKLPLGASGNFYPDFIAELADGKILVAEYKGQRGENDESEILKRRAGEKMEKLGGAFFAWITARGATVREKRASIQRQLQEKIAAVMEQ